MRDRAFYPPINHLIVLKDEVLQRYPDAAAAVYTAFSEAKERYVAQLASGQVADLADRMYAAVMKTTGADPLPYGVELNRPILEQLLKFALEQHILTRPIKKIDDVFV